jgi:hypothetical protein
MSRLSLWSIAFLAGLAVVPAAAGGDPRLAVTTDAGFATSYVFRGLRLAQHSWQPAVTVERGPFSGGVWANVPLDRAGAHEVDPFFFYSAERGGLTWETGAQVYTYPEAHGADTTHSYELSLGVTAPLGLVTGVPVNAGLTVAYDLRLATLSTEARLEHSTEGKLAGRPAELTAGVFLGSVAGRDLAPDAPGPRRRDAYRYYGTKVSLAVKLAARAALKFTVQWDDARNAAPAQGATGNLAGNLGLSWMW